MPRLSLGLTSASGEKNGPARSNRGCARDAVDRPALHIAKHPGCARWRAAIIPSPRTSRSIAMAHYCRPLAAAAALNTAIFVVEAVAGFKADSLSLIMDSVHNLSDEMALVFLYLAFVLPHGISRHLLRSANVFNSVGLVLVSGLLLWQAAERILHPAPANWGVARLLLAPSRNNAAIRLAYIHNIGDVYVSLAPVAAGLLVSLTSYPIFDPLIAAGIAMWIIASTVREVFASSEELIWPEKIVCGHSDQEEAAIGAAPSQP